MGMFAAMHPKDRKQATRLNLTTIPDLVRLVERGEPVAIVKMKGSSKWNFRWTAPTLRRQPGNVYRKFENAIRNNYRSVKKTKTIEVLVPK